MRHLVLILAVSVAIYFGWRLASTRSKNLFKAFIREHAVPIFAILGLIFGALVTAFHIGSISLL